jgi:hypothetical protein
MSGVVGTCALCLRHGELRRSHLLPAALYRIVGSGSNPKNPNTILITTDGSRESSKQAWLHLLCGVCEKRFCDYGERWVLQNCYRGRGRFRLRESVRQRPLLSTDEQFEVYSASEDEIAHLAYFALSVTWRASLCDWPHRGLVYEHRELGPYQDEIRRYLSGDSIFPQFAAVNVNLSRLPVPVLAFKFPESFRALECHCHRFHIPGMSFVVALGRRNSQLRDLCIVKSSSHPIFVNTLSDERVQDEFMRLLGKDAPQWAKYPLMNGTEIGSQRPT